MDTQNRIVTQFPLRRLWRDSGEVEAVRGPTLDRTAIKELLRRGEVQFVVADVGEKLRWVPNGERFEFWKSDASSRIVESETFSLEDFPEDTAYVASRWQVPDEEAQIVLLEVHH